MYHPKFVIIRSISLVLVHKNEQILCVFIEAKKNIEIFIAIIIVVFMITLNWALAQPDRIVEQLKEVERKRRCEIVKMRIFAPNL